MSAMEEYKRVCAIVRGREYWAVDRSEVADAADAVIAELEGGYVKQLEQTQAWCGRAEQAEAENRSKEHSIEAMHGEWQQAAGDRDRQCERANNAVERAEQAEAALAERDGMLQLAARERPLFELNGRMQTADDWLAELRRRTEGKKP